MDNTKKISELYNDAYRFVTPDFLSSNGGALVEKYLKENNESLLRFVKSFLTETGEIKNLTGKDLLETGCGLGGFSHYFDSIGCRTLGVDISNFAISGAREIASMKRNSCEFEVLDVRSSVDLGRKFDFIVDSHLLHCLTDRESRDKYFSFVKRHLKDNGLFLVETATFDDEIREPLGYDLDEDFVLHQEISGEFFPIRKILRSIDLENEILENDLKINTFYYHFELCMDVFSNVKNYPAFRLPKTVRYTAKLN